MKIRAIPFFILAFSVSGCNSNTDENINKENASICFNKTLYEVGTTYSVTYKDQDNNIENSTVNRIEETEYRGQSAQIQSNGEGERYFSVDTYNKQFTLLGGRDDDNEFYYIPGLITKFDVNSGDIQEETVTMISKGLVSDVESVQNITSEYKGFETITVPAGTYKSCKFETNYTYTQPDGLTNTLSTVVWYGENNGLPIQFISKNETKKLIQAEINGSNI